MADRSCHTARRHPAECLDVGDGLRVQSARLVSRVEQECDDARDCRDEHGQEHRHSGDDPHALLHTVSLREEHGDGQLAVAEPAEGDPESRVEGVHLEVDGDRDAEHRDHQNATEHRKRVRVLHDGFLLIWIEILRATLASRKSRLIAQPSFDHFR